MPDENKIKDFLTKKPHCSVCQEFQKNLTSEYAKNGIEGATNFSKNYEGVVCANLQTYLYFYPNGN